VPLPDVRAQTSHVPAAVAAIIARATRLDPRERFASMREMANAIAKLLPPTLQIRAADLDDGRAIPVVKPAEPTARAARSPAFRPIVAVALGLTLTLATLGFRWPSKRPETQAVDLAPNDVHFEAPPADPSPPIAPSGGASAPTPNQGPIAQPPSAAAPAPIRTTRPASRDRPAPSAPRSSRGDGRGWM
jgi:serine/threonine-protein kinase